MTVPFTVLNQAGSNATNRFRLVFKQLAPVPVTFTQVKAEGQPGYPGELEGGK